MIAKVTLTADEAEIVRAEAKRRGLSVSAHLRSCALEAARGHTAPSTLPAPPPERATKSWSLDSAYRAAGLRPVAAG